ncbi:hypothetical protein TRVA0_018S01992 [Trichomonascus vanleenenianus]|uniref:uncharacterized protein n=1 Tax=Trichomonascus vanleenenianus TaxID=2268995 RepID=UPI003ECA4E2A
MIKELAVRVSHYGLSPSASTVESLFSSCKRSEFYRRLGRSLIRDEEGFTGQFVSSGIPLEVERINIELAFRGNEADFVRLANYAVSCLFYDKVCKLCSGMERVLGGDDNAEEDELIAMLSRYLARDGEEEGVLKHSLMRIRDSQRVKPFCVFFA